MAHSDTHDQLHFVVKPPVFKPAKPWNWAISIVQTFIRIDLFLHNRLHVQREDLQLVRNLPESVGVVLVSNHADEVDFKVCMELSRLCGRRFVYMMNREAFDEGFGIAGWWLQRLGAFSVERGGETARAKKYAVDVVECGHDVLVLFPEGEIYYLNDIVQPFKTGAVDIAMQAIVESRQSRAARGVRVVPMAIKYHYRQDVHAILEERVRQMEIRLSRHVRTHALKERIGLILAEVLHRKEIAHNLKAGSARLGELSTRILDVQRSVLQQMETKYADAVVTRRAETMDRSWRLSSHLRGLLTQTRSISVQAISKLCADLVEMKHVADMESWQPIYFNVDPSEERLAEMVLKLEREIYGIKRPRQLARRDVFVRLGKPIDFAEFLPQYQQDASRTRHQVTEQLRENIQALIDGMETELQVRTDR